jgi:hypothetical protein
MPRSMKLPRLDLLSFYSTTLISGTMAAALGTLLALFLTPLSSSSTLSSPGLVMVTALVSSEADGVWLDAPNGATTRDSQDPTRDKNQNWS